MIKATFFNQSCSIVCRIFEKNVDWTVAFLRQLWNINYIGYDSVMDRLHNKYKTILALMDKK